MKQMIQEYENARMLLGKRIHELTEVLRDPELQHIERDNLTQRRDLLTAERIGLLHAIREMELILAEQEGTDENTARDPAIRPISRAGAVPQSDDQPPASGDRTPGAA